MSDPAAIRSYLQSEIEGLAAFDFVAVGPSRRPLHVLEVTRREDLKIEVRVPGRPPVVPALPDAFRGALAGRGFVSEDPEDPTRPWVREVSDTAEAVDLVLAMLVELFQEKPEANLDIAHGSHQAEHEARQKVAEVREHIERVLVDMGGQSPEQDADADYLLGLGDVHVTIAPRAMPGGVVIVRVFAITNVNVNVAPELGLMLARLNFNIMFGRFALDAEHRSIWVDETLLGGHFDDEELKFTIGAVASIADEWDDRLKQLFGGSTHQEVLAQQVGGAPPTNKPGQGFYL